jgi:hypothetical protein
MSDLQKLLDLETPSVIYFRKLNKKCTSYSYNLSLCKITDINKGIIIYFAIHGFFYIKSLDDLRRTFSEFPIEFDIQFIIKRWNLTILFIYTNTKYPLMIQNSSSLDNELGIEPVDVHTIQEDILVEEPPIKEDILIEGEPPPKPKKKLNKYMRIFLYILEICFEIIKYLCV